MPIISVSHLKKYYKIYKRSAGLFPTVSSLFKRRYEEVKAVDDITFTINQGELIGFICPNGAGKTTTLKCLSGLLVPTSGKVTVCSSIPFKRKYSYLKEISLVMGQKNQLWWDLPAIDTFRLNKEIYQLSDDSFHKRMDTLTSLLDASDIIYVPVRNLSLGQRMKMELIAALLHDPKVLFLDEPTIGLDVVMQKKMRDFISEYNRKFRATIILTSHYMSDVKELCKRIIIIDRGKIMYDGRLDELVRKYTVTKIITAKLSNPVSNTKLRKLGNKYIYRDGTLKMIVPTAQSKQITMQLLSGYPVEDLMIEEPEIEDIIREVFQTHS
jgi:ABC-2 type transport system ATP-binding protein